MRPINSREEEIDILRVLNLCGSDRDGRRSGDVVSRCDREGRYWRAGTRLRRGDAPNSSPAVQTGTSSSYCTVSTQKVFVIRCDAPVLGGGGALQETDADDPTAFTYGRQERGNAESVVTGNVLALVGILQECDWVVQHVSGDCAGCNELGEGPEGFSDNGRNRP